MEQSKQMNSTTTETSNYQTLLDHLYSENEEHFIRDFQAYENRDFQTADPNIDYKKIYKLLVACMCQCPYAAFYTVIHSRYFATNFDGHKLIIEAAILNEIIPLTNLLEHPHIQYRRDELLSDCVGWRCHEATFSTFKRLAGVDVNASDAYGCRPISLAVMRCDWECVKFLLKNSAYLTTVDVGKCVTSIPANLWEEHFNDCIEKLDDTHEIAMKFQSLFARRNTTMENACLPVQVDDEMAVISKMAESEDHRSLLLHPLIQSFVCLKWRSVARVSWLNFFSHFVFALMITAFVLLKYQDTEYQVALDILGIWSCIGMACVSVRELIQLLMLPSPYISLPIKALVVLTKITLVVLSVLSCIEPSYLNACQHIVDAFTVLLVGFELCRLMGTLPVMIRDAHKQFPNSEAHLYEATISRCKIISNYDNFRRNRSKLLNIILNPLIIFCPYQNPQSEIIVPLNNDISGCILKGSILESIYFIRTNKKFTRLPQSIVQSALAVIERKGILTSTKDERRLKKLLKNLDNLWKKLRRKEKLLRNEGI